MSLENGQRIGRLVKKPEGVDFVPIVNPKTGLPFPAAVERRRELRSFGHAPQENRLPKP